MPLTIAKCRRMFYRIIPTLMVSSSLGSILTLGNIIIIAITHFEAPTPQFMHGVVALAIAHVAVTVVAIMSSSYLSTKVDFLWLKMEKEYLSAYLYDDNSVCIFVLFVQTHNQVEIHSNGETQ